jgi:hypothetical protein
MTREDVIVQAIRKSDKLPEDVKAVAIQKLAEISAKEENKPIRITWLRCPVKPEAEPWKSLAAAFCWSSEDPGRDFWIRIVKAI